jgi:hypothetical protein
LEYSSIEETVAKTIYKINGYLQARMEGAAAPNGHDPENTPDYMDCPIRLM